MTTTHGEARASLDLANSPELGEIAVPRLSSIVGRLSLVNVLVVLAGFVAGPLQARALGPDGRGELAAIIVPLALAPQILALALGAYAAREVASGRRSLNELVGSLGLPLLLLGALGMAGAAPVANALADGRETVQTFLNIGFLLLPVSLLGGLGVVLLAGLERWGLMIATKAIPVTVLLLGVVTLYLLEEMTVARVAILTLVGGSLSILPAVVLILRAGRPVFRFSVTLASLSFGLRAWIGGLAQLANARLDQLVMITLVSSRELGLYVVAVTLAGLSSFFVSAVGAPLITRVAKGETALVPRALRVTLVAIVGMHAALASATPVLLPALFGSAFKEAVAPALVLLAAGVPLAGIAVLGPALAADGAPGVPSVGEGIALGLTVPGLAILVPAYGGMGAAVVSLTAYSVCFAYQLLMVRRRLGGTVRTYLLPHSEDVRWATALATSRWRQFISNAGTVK